MLMVYVMWDQAAADMGGFKGAKEIFPLVGYTGI